MVKNIWRRMTDWALAMANENLIDKETFQVDETPSGPLELIDKLKKQNKHIGRKYKDQKRKYSEHYNTIIEKKTLAHLVKISEETALSYITVLKNCRH